MPITKPAKKIKKKESPRRTISLPNRIYDAAIAQAEKQNRSFSNYVQSLILRDASVAN